MTFYDQNLYDELTMLKGRSGTTYQFTVVPKQTAFQAKPGVYVLAKALGDRKYTFCFVGEAADLSIRPFHPEKMSCFNQFGWTTIFITEEYDSTRRADMVSDLIQAYGPICNTP